MIGSTVQAAARVAAGQAVTAATSASVASVAKGVMNTMLISKLKMPVGLVLAFGLLTLGWGAYEGTRSSTSLVGPAFCATHAFNLPLARSRPLPF